MFFDECGKTETFDGKKWKNTWQKYKDGVVCKRHANKYIWNPQRSKEYIKKYNDRRPPGRQKVYNDKYSVMQLTFGDNHHVQVSFQIRKGQCQQCGKKIGDRYINCKGRVDTIKRTHTHHLEYYIIFPWFATTELCISCHSKETQRERRIKKNFTG
jgi:hypothetical protein